MDTLAKKWKQLVAGTESMLTTGNTKQPTTLTEVYRHPDASAKLPIKCVKVMSDNLDIDIKSSGDSSPETSSANSANLVEYSISQSSSKVFGLNKSAANSYTTQLNVVLAKEAAVSTEVVEIGHGDG
jgi:hypothetical protein